MVNLCPAANSSWLQTLPEIRLRTGFDQCFDQLLRLSSLTSARSDSRKVQLDRAALGFFDIDRHFLQLTMARLHGNKKWRSHATQDAALPWQAKSCQLPTISRPKWLPTISCCTLLNEFYSRPFSFPPPPQVQNCCMILLDRGLKL